MTRAIRLPATPVNAITAVRQHFGLSQQELADWLGVSKAQAGHLETGQRALSGATIEALAPLAAALPPAGPVPAPALRLASAAPPALVMALGVPEATLLTARLEYCRQHAHRLRQQVRPLAAEATLAARWAAVLPTLRAALPPDPGPHLEPDPATNWPAWLVWHRHRWLASRLTALPPARSARYHLLRLQAEALDAEATALEALLAA